MARHAETCGLIWQFAKRYFEEKSGPPDPDGDMEVFAGFGYPQGMPLYEILEFEYHAALAECFWARGASWRVNAQSEQVQALRIIERYGGLQGVYTTGCER